METVMSWGVMEIPVCLTTRGSSLELMSCVTITKNEQHPEL